MEFKEKLLLIGLTLGLIIGSPFISNANELSSNEKNFLKESISNEASMQPSTEKIDVEFDKNYIENIENKQQKYIYKIELPTTGKLSFKVTSNISIQGKFYYEDKYKLNDLLYYPPGEGVGCFKSEDYYEPGTYYIVLYMEEGQPEESKGNFEIEFNFEEALSQDVEPNNHEGFAQKLEFGEKVNGLITYNNTIFDSYGGETDIFKFNLYEDTDINILVESYLYNNILQITDERGRFIEDTVMYSNSTQRPIVHNKKYTLGRGTYYIKFTGQLNRGFYNIKVDKSIKDIVGHWAEPTISKFINQGYINGYLDGTFRPENSITRAEFVKIFNKKFGLINGSGKVFNDTAYHWAKNEIDIAVTNGVCQGKSSTEFDPDGYLTREEAAKMIANYKKISDTFHDRLNRYNDSWQVSNWAKNEVEAVLESGYMNGYAEDKSFKPLNNITRAEAVVTLSRVN